MLFHTHIFVFLFLPVVLIGYYGLHRAGGHKAAQGLLLLSSFVFYAYYNPLYILILAGSILGNYGIYRLLRSRRLQADFAAVKEEGAGDALRTGQSSRAGRLSHTGQVQSYRRAERLRKAVMIAGVAANLAVLFWFKYFNFFLSNVNTVFRADFHALRIVMPLGISFFTFQQISFVVDSYRENDTRYSLLEYSVFVSFFPQLVAGPIVLHKQIIPQLSEKERWICGTERMGQGIRYFVMGLAKKCLIADALARIVNVGFESCTGLSSPQSLLVIIAYTLQIYFDFSGYSDMAIGLGRMFGLDIPVNFNSPYKAVNIADFWKRWHMTMTGFFTQYLYIPLGGNRKGKLRTYLNVMIVFALSGLWHGAAWTFVLWGILHGAALVFHRMFREKIEKMPHIFTAAATFVFVNLAWVIFRAEGIAQARGIFMALIKGGIKINSANVRLGDAFCDGALTVLGLSGAALARAGTLLMLGYVALALFIALLAPSSHEIARRKKPFKGEGIVWGVLGAMAVMTFAHVSEFLYFNF